MPSLGLSLNCVQNLVLKLCLNTGYLTCLTKTQGLLERLDKDVYQELLDQWPGDMEEYRSVMDYLLCEGWVIPFKEACRLYYAEQGPKLVEAYHPLVIEQIDSKLYWLVYTVATKIKAELLNRPYYLKKYSYQRIHSEIRWKEKEVACGKS